MKMKKIMFNDKFGLTQSVLNNVKKQTRRNFTLTLHEKIGDDMEEVFPEKVYTDNGNWKFVYRNKIFSLPKQNCPKYNVGDIVAIAQRYEDIVSGILVDDCKEFEGKDPWMLAGWKNKMFVRPEYMIHHIRITRVEIQRIQDITDEDCINEGVLKENENFVVKGINKTYKTPKEAFKELIVKMNGKKFWQENRYVWVYSFELID